MRPREKLTFQGCSFAYAGHWRRMQACILDLFVLWPLTLALDALIRVSIGVPFGDDFAFEFASQKLQWKYVPIEEVGMATVLLYFAAFESSVWQATPGKYWIGLAVFDQQGHRLSFLHALGRAFCKFFSIASFGVGFLMVLWTARKQALRDLMTGCLVMEWLDTAKPADPTSPEPEVRQGLP